MPRLGLDTRSPQTGKGSLAASGFDKGTVDGDSRISGTDTVENDYVHIYITQ